MFQQHVLERRQALVVARVGGRDRGEHDGLAVAAQRVLEQVRERVGFQQQSGDRVRRAMRTLTNYGWVVTSQSGNTVGFSRDGLVLLLELEDGKLLLSGTGAVEAREDLNRRE